jgi:hypothetical protein
VMITVVLLLAFIVGFKIRYAAFFSALIITHLSGIHYVISNSGCTWLPVIYFLMIFALYAENDKISIDHFLSLKKKGISKLNQLLRSDDEKHSHIILLHLLVITSLIYFFTGISKLIIVGFEWASSGYMNRLLLREYLFHLNVLPFFSKVIIEYEFLGLLSGVLTIVLEISLLVVVLLKRNITLFVIGLAGMHIMIALTMEVFFFDQFILYLLFIPWDTIIRQSKGYQPLRLVYDNGCLLCASVLNIFKYFDIKRELHFYSTVDKPEYFSEIEDHLFSNEMFLYNNEKLFSGFSAFRVLFAKWWYFFPFYKLLYIGWIERIGKRIYKLIATNRQEIYGCKIQ